MRAPTKIPSCALPTGLGVCKVLVTGQSNAVGAQQAFLRQNQNVPHYFRAMTLHDGVTGYWDRNGAMFGDQFYPQAKYKGVQEQLGLDLTAAGKKPILATIAKSGTSITEFLNGSSTDLAFQQYASELVAMVGATGWHVPILWGEADALTLALSTAWQANLTAFVAKLRTYFPGARIYLLMLNSSYVGNDPTWNQNVRNGNLAFVAGDSNAEIVYANGFGFADPHYNNAGYDALGSLFASRILAQINGPSSLILRPPPRHFQNPAFRRSARF